MVGTARRPDAERALDRPSAGSCSHRLSRDRFRRPGRFRNRGGMAAPRRGAGEAQLSRQSLAHRLDLQPHVGRGREEPAGGASAQGPRGGLRRGDLEERFSKSAATKTKSAAPKTKFAATKTKETATKTKSSFFPESSLSN